MNIPTETNPNGLNATCNTTSEELDLEQFISDINETLRNDPEKYLADLEDDQMVGGAK